MSGRGNWYNKASRLIREIFLLLQDWHSTEDLARRVGCHRRTAQRDIIDLSTLCYLEERFEGHKPQYRITKAGVRDGI